MTEMKVVPINTADKPEAQLKVIQRLEEALDIAREGNYHSVALVMLSNDGDVLDCWYSGGRPYVMVGALEALKHEYMTANIDLR